MLRRLGMLRDIEGVEYVAEGVRSAGVARLFLVCDDILELHSSAKEWYMCEAGWLKEKCHARWTRGNRDGAGVGDFRSSPVVFSSGSICAHISFPGTGDTCQVDRYTSTGKYVPT